MRKKSFLVALFCGALCLTGCLKNAESDSVSQVRVAKANELNSIAELNKAQAAAEAVYAQAELLIKQAEAALINAQAETEKVKAELLKVQVKLQEVKVDEERVELQKLQAELEVLLAKAEAEKQEWINKLNNFIAQAEVDAIKNAQDLLEAQADMEAYILTLEGEKAEKAQEYADKYFAALERITELQFAELQAKARKVLANQNAGAARQALLDQQEKNTNTIAENDTMIAFLKEYQILEPAEVEAKKAELKVALSEAYVAYKAATEINNTAKENSDNLNNQSADFQNDWDSKFVSTLKKEFDIKSKSSPFPGAPENITITSDNQGFYDEDGNFVPLYAYENKEVSYSERYPAEGEVHDPSQKHILVNSRLVIPATIYYDNIKTALNEKLTKITEDEKAEAGKEKKFYIDGANAKIDDNIKSYEEKVAFYNAYIAVRKDSVEKAETAFMEVIGGIKAAQDKKESTWNDFVDYMAVNYDIDHSYFTKRYDAEKAYTAAKNKSEAAKIDLEAAKAKEPGLKQAVADAKKAEAEAEGAYNLALSEIEGETDAKQKMLDKEAAHKTAKEAVPGKKTTMDNAKTELDAAEEYLVRHPKGTDGYAAAKAARDAKKTAYDNAVEAYNDAVEAESKAKIAYDKAKKEYNDLVAPSLAAKKVWDDAKKTLAAAEKALSDNQADTKAGGKTYEAWKSADTATTTAKENLTTAENNLIAALKVKKIEEALDEVADAKYKAYLEAKEAAENTPKIEYDKLNTLYYTKSSDGKTYWVDANYQANTGATMILKDDDGNYVKTPIAKKVRGTIAPFTYKFVYNFDSKQVEVKYTYDSDAEKVPDYTKSSAFELELLKAKKAALPDCKKQVDDKYAKNIKAKEDEFATVIANVEGYKKLESSYTKLNSDRVAANEAYVESQKKQFDAECKYKDAKAEYNAADANYSGVYYDYDPTNPKADKEGFVKLTVNEEIAKLEKENKNLEQQNAEIATTLEQGENVLEYVNQIIDKVIEEIGQQIEIATAIANQLKAIMNSYLGIVEE